MVNVFWLFLNIKYFIICNFLKFGSVFDIYDLCKEFFLIMWNIEMVYNVLNFLLLVY